MYKLTGNPDLIVRLADGMSIPRGHRWWVEYEAWQAAGNSPLPHETPEEARARQWEAIKAVRDRRTQAGGYPAAGKWFHSDTFSRTQQIGLVMLGANIPPGLMWKTMDGSFIEMTPTLAQQVFAAAAAQDTATFAAAEIHKAAMEAAPDPAAYSFTAGWPAVFGG